MLYDYIFHFSSKETALESLPEWFNADGEPYAFMTHSGAMMVDLVTNEGAPLVGYALLVTTPEPLDSLFELDACLVELLRPAEATVIDACVVRSKPEWRSFMRPEPECSGVMYDWNVAA